MHFDKFIARLFVTAASSAGRLLATHLGSRLDRTSSIG